MWSSLHKNWLGKCLEPFYKTTETRKICTTDWEIISHIDYPTAELEQSIFIFGIVNSRKRRLQ